MKYKRTHARAARTSQVRVFLSLVADRVLSSIKLKLVYRAMLISSIGAVCVYAHLLRAVKLGTCVRACSCRHALLMCSSRPSAQRPARKHTSLHRALPRPCPRARSIPFYGKCCVFVTSSQSQLVALPRRSVRAHTCALEQWPCCRCCALSMLICMRARDVVK